MGFGFSTLPPSLTDASSPPSTSDVGCSVPAVIVRSPQKVAVLCAHSPRAITVPTMSLRELGKSDVVFAD
jgi:hypothetical protein